MLSSPRIRRWLDQLLHTHDTPQRTAAAYALGVFFGFSPLLGLHTVLGPGVRLRPQPESGRRPAGDLLEPALDPPGVLHAGDDARGGDPAGGGPAGALRDLRRAQRRLVGRLPPAGPRPDAPRSGPSSSGPPIGAVILAVIAYRVSLAMIDCAPTTVELSHKSSKINKLQYLVTGSVRPLTEASRSL